MPIAVSDSKFINNLNGVLFGKTSARVSFTRLEARNQRNNGILASEFDGWMSLRDVVISNNTKHGFYFSKSHICKKQYVTNRFAAHLHVESSVFDSNKATGLHFSLNCRNNVTIMTSNFTNNTLASYIKHTSGSGVDVVDYVLIQDSIYSANKRAVSIEGSSSLNMLIQGNQFKENLGYALKVSTDSSYNFVRLSEYTFTKNVFSSNDAKFDSLVSVVVLSDRKYMYKNIKDIKFVENYLYGNTYTPPERYFVYSQHSQQGILHVHTETNVQLHHNIMDNPEAEVQLYVADQNPNLIQQAHHCYWGTTDINTIFRQVYSDYHALGYSKVQLLPILNSTNFSDLRSNLSVIPEFVQGQMIGGHLFGNIELKEKTRPYIVDKDIFIEKDQSLSVSPGVTLLFERGKSVYVKGKLNIEGTQTNPVVLGQHRDESQHPVRIQQDNQQNIIKVKVHNEWYSICSEESTSMSKATADFFCQTAGYENSVRSSRVYNKTEAATSIGKVKCPPGNHHLGACYFELNFNCTQEFVFQVQCAPSYWSGIYFAYDAARSFLRYVKLDRTGHPNGFQGQTAIQSDVHRHEFSHITLTNMRDDRSTVGIKILKVDVASNHTISDIYMNDFNHRGTGVISYDARLRMTNTNIQNHKTSLDNGIYIESSMISIPSLLHDEVPSVCSNTSYNLSKHEFLFFHVRDGDINRYTKCELLINTDPGRKISVQVVSGYFRNLWSCRYDAHLFFYDGHKEDSNATSVKIDSDGFFWTSTGDQAHIIMHRNYGSGCINAVIQISSINGKQMQFCTI